jgi:tetratricopeptide (TPR) repeat protein
MRHSILLLTLLTFLVACARVPTTIAPVIQAPPHIKEIQREKRIFCHIPADFSLSPFPSLNQQELATDWGKEYRLALCFAQDFDLYRAITGFKRALWLLPQDQPLRRLEIEYDIALAYFLGGKFVEVVFAVESTDLICVDETFLAFDDLLLMLYESYEQLGKPEHAAHILQLIEQNDPHIARKLSLLSMVKQADFAALCYQAEIDSERSYLKNIICGYQREAKSIRKAQILNGVLPGAGYWYVGQRSTAVTAFIINTLFIAAATHFITSGNGAAGLITLSFESGWYFGGITGAGYAAKQYNEQLYCTFANKITQRESYFPLMMLKYTF